MRFPDKHASRDKHLLKLERELNRLWHARVNAPVIPLERPYQRGWEKFYVLSEGISRRSDAAMFTSILSQINQRVYSRHRSFITQGGHEIVLRPRIIPTRDWLKLGWTARYQRFFSYGSWRLENRHWTTDRCRPHVVGFKLTQRDWIREDIQPYIVTHVQVELPAVRSRMTEIEAYFDREEGRHRLGKLHGRSRWWRLFSSTAHELRAGCSLHEQRTEIHT